MPSAPTITSNGVAGSGQLSVDFTAPTSNGGAAITNYQYSTDAGATWRAFSPADTTTPVVISTLSTDGITPLANTTYPIELRAVNSAGVGVASATNDGTAADRTGRAGAEHGHHRFGLAAGHLHPGRQRRLADHRATSTRSTAARPGTSTGTLGSTFTVTGLTNGTSYTVLVRGDQRAR